MTEIDSSEDLHEALSTVGVPSGPPMPDDGADLVIDPGGVHLRVQVKRRSLVDEAVAEKLVRDSHASMTSVVVADRVTAMARKVLIEGGAGYLDLRGHLAIRANGILINSDVAPRSRQLLATDPLASTAGKEVASALLTQPDRTFSVRGLATELHRAPSTVSGILKELRASGAVDNGNSLTDPETLFWQLAARWSTPRTYLQQAPTLGSSFQLAPLRLGVDSVDAPGWALSADIAAATYGAPIAVAGGQLREFYVQNPSVVRRAATILGQAVSALDAQCTVRVAPVAAICSRRIDIDQNPTQWPLAHPVYVALDLAQDAGRGQEILQSWTPKAPWRRVW